MSVTFPDVSTRLNDYASATYFYWHEQKEHVVESAPKSLLLLNFLQLKTNEHLQEMSNQASFLAFLSTSSIIARIWPAVTPDVASGMEPTMMSVTFPDVSTRLNDYASAAYFYWHKQKEHVVGSAPKSLLLLNFLQLKTNEHLQEMPNQASFLAFLSISSIIGRIWPAVTPNVASGVEPTMMSVTFLDVSTRLNEYASAAYFYWHEQKEHVGPTPKSLLLLKFLQLETNEHLQEMPYQASV